jgi:hypothetical protein
LDVIVAVGIEGHDKVGRMVIKGIVSEDGKEEIALDIFLLRALDFLATFVDNSVLV